ncbi:MAG: MFS transporter [Bacteroidales bacterium]|jgi:NRE family putative nickel resistance protein-like MFS transporter
MARLVKFFSPFSALREKLFARLYIAQAVSLLGDAVTWLGIALLAFEFGGDHSAGILSVALTLRVTAYIVFGPYAGVLADRLDRKKILYTTHFIRMALVAALPFVQTLWQLYTLIFFLNVFHAFFTPAFKSAIPQVISKRENYSNAIVLSNGTWQLLGMLGPGLAGGLAAFMGARQIFFFDAITFLVAAFLILAIPGKLIAVSQDKSTAPARISAWSDISRGTRLLFKNPPIRFAVMIEMIIAIAGAQIFVNTVGLVKGGMGLNDQHYGWVMMAFGIGATLAVFSSNTLDRSQSKRLLLLLAATVIISAISFANFVPYTVLLVLWVFAGLGQGFTYLPSQIMVAENIPIHEQGRVYGAHFAWVHLFWGFGYILAGITGNYFYPREFLAGGAVSLILFTVVLATSLRKTGKPS